ncbi:MAG: Ldh family oxidoreductase, partial [Desulfobulbia bacterium]
MEQLLFSVKRLEEFIRSALVAHGVQTDHAEICATQMIAADLRGMHGHGIYRLPGYCRRLE